MGIYIKYKSAGPETPPSDMAYVIGKGESGTQLSAFTHETWNSPEGEFSNPEHTLFIDNTSETLCEASAFFLRETTLSGNTTVGTALAGKVSSAAEMCSTHYWADTSPTIAQ